MNVPDKRVFVVTSGKGGVGKTLVAAGLGAALASLGHRVALVDADTGLRKLDVALGLENRVVYDSVDVVRGRCSLREALVRDKRLGTLYFLPAAQREDKTAVSPEDMREICARLAESFDFVLVDSPAGIEHGFRTAARAAEAALLVTTPDIAAVRDADRVAGLLAEVGLAAPLLVVNRARPRLERTGDSLSPEDVAEALRLRPFAVLPEDERAVVCGNRGLPVTLDPASAAGRALRAAALRLAGEPCAVPRTPNRKGGGLLGRLAGFLKGEVAPEW
ncbi:septum site-determining protein MinD [Desulfovirgula thermocuniculi]|uniref:septum site-determining protein MinD n=1 Tax=Desulfovirgula thermocuniculi TaxID=348842 RepID=UPI00054EA7EE|nr:septum site-determining protein MinD [Desulfovirgula thermocuniculi]